MSLSEYCRDIETYLCRKNDGHLIRIVGPSFEIVSRWAADGVPLKVAMAGVDRYFERYYRKGPRRRPVKIDFCEADVLDVFDEWRRATGLTVAAPAGAGGIESSGAPARRRGPSLPEHLERALLRLSSLRATGVLGDDADRLLDRVSSELDAARAKSAGVRGEARRATLERLASLDADLVACARASVTSGLLAALGAEADGELSAYRSTMAADAFERARELAVTRLLRERLGLPVIAFS
ncbi:MAG TPA: hypothetical protein VM032_10745 [Vicinamibacterales bacterium]|nr:hypothetical protein [Vicinamibacterales bacterium]